MKPNFDRHQSAPSKLLNQAGSAISLGTLTSAAGQLSDADLRALEDDLTFYDQTGVVGLHVSRILSLLSPHVSDTQAGAELAA